MIASFHDLISVKFQKLLVLILCLGCAIAGAHKKRDGWFKFFSLCYLLFINYNLKFIAAPFPSNSPQRTYLPPSQQQQTPSGSYGPPSQQQAPSSQYGAPQQQQQFGSPSQGISHDKYLYKASTCIHLWTNFYYFLRNLILKDLLTHELSIFH